VAAYVWRRYSYIGLPGRQIGQTDVTTIVANQKNFDDVGSSVRRFGSRRLWSRRFDQFDEPSKRRLNTGLVHGRSTDVTPFKNELKKRSKK
jgi:hypothetical protein